MSLSIHVYVWRVYFYVIFVSVCVYTEVLCQGDRTTFDVHIWWHLLVSQAERLKRDQQNTIVNQTISWTKSFPVLTIVFEAMSLLTSLAMDMLTSLALTLMALNNEHVDLGTRQKLRRRGKKGKRRRKQNYNKDNKKTREQGHFSSLGTFRLWPSCSVTVIQINSGTINTIMKVVVDRCSKI